MKKIVLLSVLAVIQFLPVTAQLQGDGSMGNPYKGTLQGAFTISGTKYFSGIIIVNNEQLTIAPGTTLIAATSTSGILVTNTGQLNAQGNATNRILITSDSDLDGIIGEPTDTWGNITIISSGVSNISYCTIENGRRLSARIGYYGGGLYLGTSSVTVTSTTIRNCIAGYGGGIIVAGTTSPVISGCIITGNTAVEQGGAIYVAGGSSPVITNTIIYNNSSHSTSRGGGSVASIFSSPIIINSTIVYSSSPAADGKSIYLENSPDAKILNTIIWGSSDNISLSGTPSSVIEYCAIEGTSLEGCLTLNSSNTDPQGPNFTDPESGDFTIAFISPCRDSGTDSYPGVTIPLTDYAGSRRIGQTDIGAYEIRYSRWMGRNTDWYRGLNWDWGVLPGTTNVIIPAGAANYPTIAPGPSFTLNAGLIMIIEPGARATLSSLTNNGTLVLQADANGYATLITGSYSGAGGNANIEHYLTSGPDGDWWHYIASPATVSKTVFTDIEPEMLVRYDETKVVTDVSDGWQWHDGYSGTTPFSNLTVNEGYDVSVAEDVTMTYRNLKSLTTSIGRIDLPFSGSGGDTTIYGYSLLGNSLTCGINWDLITYSHDHKYIRHAYYLRTASGEEASYVNGVGTNGATAHIAPLQGFFVRTRATGTYITIPDNAREHNAAPRFKSAEQIPLIRLQLSSDTQTDETVVRFDQEATTGFDGFLDASKPFSHVKGHIKIYSEAEGENYSINTMPWPSRKTSIPLTLEIHEAGTYKIRGIQYQTFTGYTVVLTDRLKGSRISLEGKAGYSFTAAEGTISGRFALEIIPEGRKAIIAASEENKSEVTEDKSLKIYSAPGRICILPQGSGWDGNAGKIRMFDITGRIVYISDNEHLYAGELMEIEAPNSGGLLIVEVVTGEKRYLEKIVLAK